MGTLLPLISRTPSSARLLFLLGPYPSPNYASYLIAFETTSQPPSGHRSQNPLLSTARICSSAGVPVECRLNAVLLLRPLLLCQDGQKNFIVAAVNVNVTAAGWTKPKFVRPLFSTWTQL